jgi:hypothetical protein
MDNPRASLPSIFAPAAENAWRLLVNFLRPQIAVPRGHIGPKNTACAVPVRKWREKHSLR